MKLSLKFSRIISSFYKLKKQKKKIIIIRYFLFFFLFQYTNEQLSIFVINCACVSFDHIGLQFLSARNILFESILFNLTVKYN